MTMRPRSSTAPIDGDDGDDRIRRRQPFRPLQPFRTSHSPSLPTKSINTPPREVILTPRATPKPMKRKAPSRPKRAAAKVKSEPPEIDLSKVRPPSPSDDPLLLLGTPPIRSPPLRARLTPAFSSSPSDATGAGPSLSFTDRLFDAGRRTKLFGSASSSDTGDLNYLPMFDAPHAAEISDAWSDSDDEFNLKGEYTGKYKLLKVPTKADPSMRMASWGRPVSPFPYSEIMERSLPLSELAEDGEGREDAMDSIDAWEVATEPPPSDVEPSSPPSVSEDEFSGFDNDFLVFDCDARSTQVRPLVERQAECPDSDQPSVEEEEEEARIERELSVAVDDGPNPFLALSGAIQPVDVMEAGSSDEEDDVEGEDIIKITSDDPKAAARAAAILRMHDYDCILAAEKKKRSSRSSRSTRQRRRTIENAGINKSYIDSKNQRWQALEGGEVSPGSRSLPLLELWRDAEDSVFLERHSVSYCDASFSLSPLKPTSTCPEPLLHPPTRSWTRECWKHLDKCLVAERLAVAAARGLSTDLFADMGDISKDTVLDRFVDQMGGDSVLAGLGPGWSRNDLMLRLDVLVTKQSRRTTRARMTARQNATQPRYRGLLQEAMALSGTTERYEVSTSAVLDTTVTSERHDGLKATQLFSDLPSVPSWQTSYVRDLIQTPSRTPSPWFPHLKDQVHLRHASVPQKSKIPIAVRPKRLVDLRHLSSLKADRTKCLPTRRSSGCKVKDLVRQFEGLDK